MISKLSKQISAETLERLKKELEYLKKVKRKEIAEQLRHAISFGDLKENAAYHEAKDAQAFLEGKIIELNNTIKSAVVTSKNSKEDFVSVGSKVTVMTENGEEEYMIVSGVESDPLSGKISSDSPIGKSLMGKKKGVKCFLETPLGKKLEMEILKIT